MSRWRATFKVWPHSTGAGQNVDQARVGDSPRNFEFEANDFNEAVRHANLIGEGITSNPHVWHAPLDALVRTGSE